MKEAFLFGFTLAIAIGPIAILILNQTINCGFRTGILSALGAGLADLTYAILTFSSGGYLQHLISGYENWFKIFSTIVLVGFGGLMIVTSLRKKSSDETKSRTIPLYCKKPLLTTFGLTLANPLTIVVFSGISGQIIINSIRGILLNSFALFTGSLIVQLAIVTAGSLLHKILINPKVITILNILSGCGIIIISIYKYL